MFAARADFIILRFTEIDDCWPNTVFLLFLQGKEYSCYSLASNGQLVAHADTLAGLSNLNYSHQGHPGIQQWVTEFVTRSNASGQVRVMSAQQQQQKRQLAVKFRDVCVD